MCVCLVSPHVCLATRHTCRLAPCTVMHYCYIAEAIEWLIAKSVDDSPRFGQRRGGAWLAPSKADNVIERRVLLGQGHPGLVHEDRFSRTSCQWRREQVSLSACAAKPRQLSQLVFGLHSFSDDRSP